MAARVNLTGVKYSIAAYDVVKPLWLLLLLLLSAVPALAQERVPSLTEDNIKAFINRTTEMTNRKSADLGGAEAKSFFEKHLHPNARFKSKMVYEIPGFPAKQAELALDKGEFIESLAGGSQAIDNYSNKINIKSVKIASSGKSATVDSESMEEGVMHVEGQAVPMLGVSTCNQILMLSDQGVIQMFNANCTTQIRFKE